MIFFHVPLPSTNIDDRCRSSSITSRETTLIEVYILHHVRIECRKQSTQMIDLIQRSTVQQKHILIIPPAMYIQPGKQFRTGRNTRQVLNGLDKIRRTQQREFRIQQFGSKRNLSGLSGKKRIIQICCNLHTCQCRCAFLQINSSKIIRLQIEFLYHFLIANIRHTKHMLPLG